MPSVLGGLISAYGGAKMSVPKLYKPREDYLKDYETRGYGDITSLYGKDAYDQPGLGYDEQEMQGMYGQGRDLAAGENARETQQLHDRFASSGGLGLRSAMYSRALQRSDLARAQRANELKRDLIVKNAAQKRADKMARIAAVTGAFQLGTGLYNKEKLSRADYENARKNAIPVQ